MIAVRLAGTQLAWDASALQLANCEAANAFLQPPYRKGWSL